MLADMIRLAFLLGCRLGELCALRWEDVDLTTGRVHIARSLTEDHGAVIVKSTKTGRDRWAQAFPAQLKDVLGQPGAPGKYLFAEKDDSPVRPHKVTDWFSHVREKAEIACTFHDIRHATASHLISAGVPIPNVARQLGHASVRTTLDIYTHALPDEQDEYVMAAMGSLQAKHPEQAQ
jgi:integrase